MSPTIEYYTQDNLALLDLNLDSEKRADFVYDNSAYHNLRSTAAFPGPYGGVVSYFAILRQLMAPGAVALVVSG